MPSCCPLPAPVPLHETLFLLDCQQYCIMKENKKHPSTTCWVKSTGRNKALKARHVKDTKQCLCKWHKMITQICFDLDKLVTPWNSEGSKEKPQFSVPKPLLKPQERNYKREEIFTVTNRKPTEKAHLSRKNLTGPQSYQRVNSLCLPLQFVFLRNHLSQGEYKVSWFILTPGSLS